MVSTRWLKPIFEFFCFFDFGGHFRSKNGPFFEKRQKMTLWPPKKQQKNQKFKNPHQSSCLHSYELPLDEFWGKLIKFWKSYHRFRRFLAVFHIKRLTLADFRAFRTELWKAVKNEPLWVEKCLSPFWNQKRWIFQSSLKKSSFEKKNFDPPLSP